MTLCLMVTTASAETLRLASWNVELLRRGPGILLRDLNRGEDPQIMAVLEVLDRADADILFLQGVDHDLSQQALTRLSELAGYPHFRSVAPNSGVQTGLDVDNDGRRGEPEDALGFGRFRGEGGMALLSRLPLGEVQDFNAFLWKDLPGTALPAPNPVWPNAETHAVLPLASVGHWMVPVRISEDVTLTLMLFHAAPPVFDGPEDRNGLRNQDQIRFWQHLMDGAVGDPPQAPFVLMADANLDPDRSDGRREAIRNLLSDRRLQDPKPASPQGLDTVDWADGPGRLRVSYILPDAAARVAGAAVLWPQPDDPWLDTILAASRHRLIWVDLKLP